MERVRDLLILAGFVALTVALGRLHPRLEVDVENVAMSSDRSPEAAIEALRDARFPRASTLILMLEPAATAATETGARTGIEAAPPGWLDAIAAAPGVHSARKLPVAAAGGAVLAAADLEPDETGAFVPAYRAAVRAARIAAPKGSRVSATGVTAGQAAVSDALRRETSRVLPVLILALALVLAATYRSFSLLVAAFLPAGGAVAWVGGLQALAGIRLDPISTLLQPTLLTVGVAGAVHVLEATLAEREDGASPAAAPGLAVRHVLTPALLAGSTTVAGFLGLTRNEIPAVRSFGWLASAGVAVACLITLLVVPAWLRLVRPRVRATRGRTWGALAGPMTAWIARRARPIVALALVAGVLAIASWTRVTVSTDPMRLLPPSHPFRVESARIEAGLGGFETLELMLAAPARNATLALAELSGKLAQVGGIARIAGAPRRSEDGAYLLTALLAPGGSAEREAAFAAAEQKAREAGFGEVASTGLAVRMTRDSERLVAGQLRGLGLTAAAIAGMLVVGLRSVRTGLLGMIPNLLPCCALYGGMAAVGRPLTVATAMIGTVFLGLVVDDSVHVLFAHRRARLAGSAPRDAVAEAFRRTGRAITITSLALAAGFAACWLGRMETTREFGVLASSIVAAAFVSNLIVLPALLLLCAPRTASR